MKRFLIGIFDDGHTHRGFAGQGIPKWVWVYERAEHLRS